MLNETECFSSSMKTGGWPKTRLCQLFFLNFYWSIVDYNVVLVSGVQQSESVIHIPISTLFLDSFPI